MKKIMIILVLVLALMAAAVGGYFYYETTMVEPKLSIETTSDYQSISGSYMIVLNDAEIDYETAVVELMLEDEVVATQAFTSEEGKFVFENVEIGVYYEVKVAFDYKYKYYSSEYNTVASKFELPAFSKDWDLSLYESNYSPFNLVSLNDGCVLYGGYKYNQPNTDISVQKIDLAGEVMWSYDLQLQGYNQIGSVIENDNNEIVVSFIDFYKANDTVFLVLDENGNEKSQLTVSDIYGQTNHDEGYYPVIAEDRGGIVFSQIYNDGLYLLTFDSDFKLVLDKRIDIDRDSIQDHKVIPYEDGYLLYYNVRTTDTKSRIELVSLDKEGNVLWKSVIDDGSYTDHTDVVIDGADVLLVGNTGDMIVDGDMMSISINSFLMKFDNQGNNTYRTSFDDLSYAAVNKIGILDDNTYFMVGSGYAENGDGFSLVFLNKDGSVKSTDSYTFGQYHRFALVSDGIVVGSVNNEIHKIVKIH